MQNSKIEILIHKYLGRKLNEQEFEELKQWIEEDVDVRFEKDGETILVKNNNNPCTPGNSNLMS